MFLSFQKRNAFDRTSTEVHISPPACCIAHARSGRARPAGARPIPRRVSRSAYPRRHRLGRRLAVAPALHRRRRTGFQRRHGRNRRTDAAAPNACRQPPVEHCHRIRVVACSSRFSGSGTVTIIIKRLKQRVVAPRAAVKWNPPVTEQIKRACSVVRGKNEVKLKKKKTSNTIDRYWLEFFIRTESVSQTYL